MSKLGDSLNSQMGGKLAAVPTGLRAQMDELLTKHRTVTAAAKAAGVDRRTWQRYASGKIKNPKPATSERIREAVRATRPAPLAGGEVKIAWQFDGRDRTVKFGGPNSQKLKPGTVDRMRAAHAAGDRDALAEAFLAGIEDSWYARTFSDLYHGDVNELSDYDGKFV